MLRKIRSLSLSGQSKTASPPEDRAHRRYSLTNEDEGRPRDEVDVSRLKMIRATVDAAFDPMFSINEQGIIIMANDAASKTFGWTFEEFMGSNISLICGHEHADKHDSYIQRYLETGIKRMIGTQREVSARRKDGSELPVQLGISEILVEGEEHEEQGGGASTRYFCAYTRDLTAEKKREQEIEMKQSLVQGMVDSSFDPMFGIDQKGMINVVNQAAVTMFGYSREEFLGKNVSMICGGEHGPRHHGYLKRYLETGERHIIGKKRQVNARRKDGSEFVIELGITEIENPHSGERQFCGFCRDITKSLQDMKIMRQQENCMTDKFFGPARTPPRSNSSVTPPPYLPDSPLQSPNSVVLRPPLTPRGSRRQRSISLGKHSVKNPFMMSDSELQQEQPRRTSGGALSAAEGMLEATTVEQ